ncbi:hypothetical protein BDK51DRAFT_43798, partial [Blyttiomyces helicus]
AWLSFSPNLRNHTCPLCRVRITLDQLCIDTFVERILRKAPSTADSVLLSADGSWTLPTTLDEPPRNGGGGFAGVEVIDLDTWEPDPERVIVKGESGDGGGFLKRNRRASPAAGAGMEMETAVSLQEPPLAWEQVSDPASQWWEGVAESGGMGFGEASAPPVVAEPETAQEDRLEIEVGAGGSGAAAGDQTPPAAANPTAVHAGGPNASGADLAGAPASEDAPVAATVGASAADPVPAEDLMELDIAARDADSPEAGNATPPPSVADEPVDMELGGTDNDGETGGEAIGMHSAHGTGHPAADSPNAGGPELPGEVPGSETAAPAPDPSPAETHAELDIAGQDTAAAVNAADVGGKNETDVDMDLGSTDDEGEIWLGGGGETTDGGPAGADLAAGADEEQTSGDSVQTNGTGTAGGDTGVGRDSPAPPDADMAAGVHDGIAAAGDPDSEEPEEVFKASPHSPTTSTPTTMTFDRFLKASPTSTHPPGDPTTSRSPSDDDESAEESSDFGLDGEEDATGADSHTLLSLAREQWARKLSDPALALSPVSAPAPAPEAEDEPRSVLPPTETELSRRAAEYLQHMSGSDDEDEDD